MVRKEIWLIGLILNFISIACSNTSISTLATKPPETVVIITDATATRPIVSTSTPVTEVNETLSNQPTPTNVNTSTSLIQVSTPMPGSTPTTNSEMAQICSINQSSSPKADQQTLYFQTLGQDWYRTTNNFVTIERVAPDGILSPDLNRLIVFGCDGSGSICVATPPEATPIPLSVRYEPQTGDIDRCVQWQSNQELVFKVEKVPLPGSDDESGIDIRLYLLDLKTSTLHQIKDKLGFTWAASPLNTCLAYTAFDGPAQIQRFHLTNIVDVDNFQDWSSAIEKSNPEWPDWQDGMTWSPDGAHLAFVKATSIVIWNPVTNERKEYQIKTKISPVLKWSPNGNKIYFIAGGSKGGFAHWILDIAEGEFRELAESSGFRSSCAYQWLPNNKEIIVPDSISGSILLNTSDGIEQKLTYPGSEKGNSISSMFFGPTLP